MEILMKNVTCGYGGVDVLNNINLSFKTGEFWCVLGANGIGKTTLFKTLLGFIDQKAGEIFVDQCNMRKIKPKEIARYISYVPQAKSYSLQCVHDISQDEKKSVLVVGSTGDITGFGENSYEAYWTDVAGLDYILPSNDGADKVNLTMEQVYEFDPDIIIAEIFDSTAVENDAGWTSLRAYEEGNLLPAPCALDNWSKPGAESMMVYLWALCTFYPEYSGDLDLTTEVINFYKDFYGYDMSEEYAELVMCGKDVIE